MTLAVYFPTQNLPSYRLSALFDFSLMKYKERDDLVDVIRRCASHQTRLLQLVSHASACVRRRQVLTSAGALWYLPLPLQLEPERAF